MHDAQRLKELQALPLNRKIQVTQARIIEWYNHWNGLVYVSRSGGKDSDVLGDIALKLYPDIPQVFINTGLEYDSVRLHAKEICTEELRPEKSFLRVLTEYGYPVIGKEVSECVSHAKKGLESGGQYYLHRIEKLMGTAKDKNGNKSRYNIDKYKFLLNAPFRISDQCCNVMKKKPAHKYAKTTERKPIIGTMANESRLRRQQWIKNGCNGFDMKTPVSNPMSFWTEQDVLEYIRRYNIKIADAYGDVLYTDEDGLLYDEDLIGNKTLITTGCQRTGCVFCMFGITQDTDRFLRLKELEPVKYNYVMRGGKFDEQGLWIPDKGLGYKFVINWLNEHGNLNIKY